MTVLPHGFSLDPLIAEAKRRARRRRSAVIALGIAVLGAVLAVALLPGYRFRPPAGLKTSSRTCDVIRSGPGLWTVLHGAAAAASAEGGCVDGGIANLVSTRGPASVLAGIPSYATPVAVGRYQGYFLSHMPGDGCAVSPISPGPCDPNPPVKMGLYVFVPNAAGPRHSVYVTLFSTGLTENQLIASALSGLRGSPPSTTQTCTQNCG